MPRAAWFGCLVRLPGYRFYNLIPEVLGWALELCPLSDAVEATDLAGDGVLVGYASKCEVGACFFSPEQERDNFLFVY